MLDHEYRKKLDNEASREWWFTIACLIVLALVIWGMYIAWRTTEFNLYTFSTIYLPAGLFALLCLISAVEGRTRVVGAKLRSFFELIFFWWP